MSQNKLNRRQMLELLGAAGSTLSFIPSTVGFSQDTQQSGDKPKLRAVLRLQFYAGWDPKMACDPPSEKYDAIEKNGYKAFLKQWNFPSGRDIGRGTISTFSNGRAADYEAAKAMQQHVESKLGTEFYCKLDKGIRFSKTGKPGDALATNAEYQPISGSVGNDIPFKKLTEDYPWVKTAQNPYLPLGPLMHLFFEKISNPNSTTADDKTFSESYSDYMTVINGIDTNSNVSHDAGAVLAACGYMPSGVGNGANLRTLQFKPTIEAIMAHQMMKTPNQFMSPSNLTSFVPFLTFNHPTLGRGYSQSDAQTNLAKMSEITSHSDLETITKLSRGTLYDEAALDATIARIVAASGAASVQEIYQNFGELLKKDGLGLADHYDEQEEKAFNGMLDLMYSRFDTNAENMIPRPTFVSSKDRTKTIADFHNPDNQEALRHSLNPKLKGTWQNSLATAAMMIRKGYSRGINISFGGHSGFIPDTHQQNDFCQMMYQGQFYDGVKRMIDYLRSNIDPETRKPLIDTTLVIVTADINRGPVYFDSTPTGTSDFRNNSLILIGGGLNHTTQAAGQTYKGRKFCYSHSGYESGRVDYTTGADLSMPKDSSENKELKITYSAIYASLLKAYGMDADAFFKGQKIFEPLAKNESKKES